MNVEKIMAEVPVTLHQEINKKIQEAVQIHKEYKTKDKQFGDYIDARENVYRMVFPLFVREEESMDSGILLEGWALTHMAIDVTVERDSIEKAELKSYLKNLSNIRDCEIKFCKERYEDYT
jgi:hypothetical protein|nr:MAG TPA: hypothetical protein [Caudoviricetes sp.]